jgi:hypothetical protein
VYVDLGDTGPDSFKEPDSIRSLGIVNLHLAPLFGSGSRRL